MLVEEISKSLNVATELFPDSQIIFCYWHITGAGNFSSFYMQINRRSL